MNMYLRLPNKFLLCLLSITGAALVGASAATINPLNDGFEEANLGTLGYQYSPPSTSWTYHSGSRAGIAANGSVFGVTGATNGNHNGATSTCRPSSVSTNGRWDSRTKRLLHIADDLASGWKL